MLQRSFRHATVVVVLLATITLATPRFATATLVAGDIAFVGYNVNGNDDFAIVTLTDILNQTVHFTNNPLSASGMLTGTGTVMTWMSGATLIPAGTVISFNEIKSVSLANHGASIGNITGILNLSSSNESLLAYQGANANTPERFLAGLENSSGAAGVVESVGLVEGLTFLDVTGTSTSRRGGEYIGERAIPMSRDAYLPLINNRENWQTVADSVTLNSFNTTNFAVAAIPEARPLLLGGVVSLLLAVGYIGRNWSARRTAQPLPTDC